MSEYKNTFGQPIGYPIADWQACAAPSRLVLRGKYCRVEPLNPATHAHDLYFCYEQDTKGEAWTYLPYGPFDEYEKYLAWAKVQSKKDDPLFYAVVDKKSEKAQGVASYLRIDQNMGVLEIGHINFSPRLQKTVAATECMYLMMRYVFDELGYRRYEWKCDALNAGSRKAAIRLGFTFEGIFRQALIYKGRNRDTAWFSITDKEWPILKKSFEGWLDPDNFTEQGQQIKSLGQFRSKS